MNPVGSPVKKKNIPINNNENGRPARPERSAVASLTRAHDSSPGDDDDDDEIRRSAPPSLWENKTTTERGIKRKRKKKEVANNCGKPEQEAKRNMVRLI